MKACRLVKIGRSCNRYKSRANDHAALRIRLKDLATSRVRYGYRRLHVLLLREGWNINHKLVYRLYRDMGLSIRSKKWAKKKRVAVPRVAPPAATQPDERWSMDFMSDRLADGRKFRVLTLVDHVSKVSPAVDVDFALTGERVVAVLDQLAGRGVLPKMICVDNGPEFISRVLDAWAWSKGVALSFSRPGKPTDNAMIESFNARVRQECLSANWFLSIDDARRTLETWRKEYNEDRPHSSLGHKSPYEHLKMLQLESKQELSGCDRPETGLQKEQQY